MINNKAQKKLNYINKKPNYKLLVNKSEFVLTAEQLSRWNQYANKYIAENILFLYEEYEEEQKDLDIE